MTSSECWVGIDGGGTKTKVHVISTTGLLLGMNNVYIYKHLKLTSHVLTNIII